MAALLTWLGAALLGRVEDMAAALAEVGDVNVQADLGRVTTTTLYVASREGKLKVVQWLWAQDGIDANLGNSHGGTPLRIVSLRSHLMCGGCTPPRER